MNNKYININEKYNIKTPKKNQNEEKKLKIKIGNKYINISSSRTSKTPGKINIKKILEKQNTKLHIKENIDYKPKINSFYSQNRSIKDLNSICTFDKVIMLQKLLKELSSNKTRFKKNINNFRDKINRKCYEYFKDKIYIKEILDYCSSNQLEEHTMYNLNENIQQYLDKDLYKIIYDFYFLIRNENYVMMEIIKLSNNDSNNKNLSDFIVNFLYENLINSSFIQDELLLIIYLLLDDLFFESFPDNINIEKTNNNLLYQSLINPNSLLFHIFQSLTKKTDIRNYLSSILNKIILKLENYRNPLSPNLSIVNKFLEKREKNLLHSFIQFAREENQETINKKKRSDLSNKQNGFDTKGNSYLKRANKIALGNSILVNEQNNTEKIVTLNEKINPNPNSSNDYKKEGSGNVNENKDMLNNKTSEEFDFNLNMESSDSNLSKKNVEIDPFFETNSVTLKSLNDKLLELKNKPISKTNSVMKEYVAYLIKRIEYEKIKMCNIDNNIDEMDIDIDLYQKKDIEIFSTSMIIEELKSRGKIANEESFKQLMKKIIKNYKIITQIILNIIGKIKEHLVSSPYIIKYISKLLSILLLRKYTRVHNNQLTNLSIYIFKLNFFLGSIILPIIKNPEFNGIITSEIISQLTKDNLKIISDIFNKIISVDLFNKNDDPFMTIFNQFIIDIMPQFFIMMENIDKNFIIPFWIKKVMTDKNNTGNINYDYFKQNKYENIQYQSICFSWKDFMSILTLIIKNENNFMKNLKTVEHKNIFQNLIKNKDIFSFLFKSDEKNKIDEYFLLTKINYRDELWNKIKSILKDEFSSKINDEKIDKDVVIFFKKCLLEILGYTKIIEKDDFFSITLNNNQTIYDINFLYQNRNKNKNNNGNVLKSSEKDLDFIKKIFPKIIENIKFEIGYNFENNNFQYLLFCCNYLNLNLNSLPNKYSRNNFNLLLNELIRETEFIIEYLKIDVLIQYYTKIKEIEKNNFVMSKYFSQIQNLEKLKCIEYFYNKIKLSNELNITKDSNGIITKIEYKPKNNEINLKETNIFEYLKNQDKPISYFIDDFPDFQKYQDENDNILDFEEKAEAPKAIYDYFSSLQKLIYKEKIITKYDKDEIQRIIYDMQNYIFTLLYDKLFPSEPTKNDLFFYKKCSRLSFIKPENVIGNKNLINENLIKNAIENVNDIDDELTPVDKIKKLGKVVEIMQNLVAFSSGKSGLGVDDITEPLIYIMIKSKPKNICSNYQYCELYLNPNLALAQYGFILSQIGVVIERIKNLKHSDLINVSKEKFGKDEVDENYF